jgi:hypothetical protein
MKTDDQYIVIFRRFRRDRRGRLLDARQYGLKAWPMKIRRPRRPRTRR